MDKVLEDINSKVSIHLLSNMQNIKIWFNVDFINTKMHWKIFTGFAS